MNGDCPACLTDSQLLAKVREAAVDAGFGDAESRDDPAKVIRTLSAVLSERETELIEWRKWSDYLINHHMVPPQRR